MSCQQGLQGEGGNTEGQEDKLTLVQLIGRADLWLKKKLLAELEVGEYKGLSNSDVLMLANLNCGRTYSSEIARRIGVSRQAVYKMLKNLEQKGIIALELDEERRNSKVIVITPKGEDFIHHAVAILDGVEDELRSILSPETVDQLRGRVKLSFVVKLDGEGMFGFSLKVVGFYLWDSMG